MKRSKVLEICVSSSSVQMAIFTQILCYNVPTHQCKGPFKCYVTLFYLKFDTHPPLRNARPYLPPPLRNAHPTTTPRPVDDKLFQVQFPCDVVPGCLGSAWECPSIICGKRKSLGHPGLHKSHIHCFRGLLKILGLIVVKL